MRHWSRAILVVLAALLTVGCGTATSGTAAAGGGQAQPAQPYAGLEDRPIRALAPERVADLLAGRGAGYALAAELNHYPGPTHVLELAPQLALSADQDQAVRAVFEGMQQEARALGKQLVDLEAELDRAFRQGEIAPLDLAQLTAAVAGIEGRLRYTHLAAHLKVKELVSTHQIARYDELRGYTAASGSQHGGGHIGH